ncbi:hypothetical protein [Rhizobium etli]|uniref:hypothetical protein n=1 Tax=Rhizobium etli TaxID=29449 RepID=UPI000589DCD3|nr:hypothetical protein [Rhizobium sp. IE4771]
MNFEHPSKEDLLEACQNNRLAQVLERTPLERLGEVGETLAAIHRSGSGDVAGALINLKWSSFDMASCL